MSAHVDPECFETATGPERRQMVDHLRACPACRADAAAHDPSILFALLSATPIPDRVLEDVSIAVSRRAGSDRGSIGGVLAAMPSTRLRAAAAALAVVALIGGYTTLRHVPSRELGASANRWAPPIVAQRADVDVHPAEAVSRVVDFTVGETQVVMVYNGDLQL